MSMGEIIIILIVAILVLGPEKLPSTAVQIAKILKALKKQVDEAKESIEKEIRVSEIKKEADKYKNEFSEYNQNIRKKLSFEEFDELKKEIVEDTNAIKEDINAIEKDLASLGGGEKNENMANLKENLNTQKDERPTADQKTLLSARNHRSKKDEIQSASPTSEALTANTIISKNSKSNSNSQTKLSQNSTSAKKTSTKKAVKDTTNSKASQNQNKAENNNV